MSIPPLPPEIHAPIRLMRRLDDMLAIDKVVFIAFIHCFEEPASDFGQYADPHIFVFQINNPKPPHRLPMDAKRLGNVSLRPFAGRQC